MFSSNWVKIYLSFCDLYKCGKYYPTSNDARSLMHEPQLLVQDRVLDNALRDASTVSRHKQWLCLLASLHNQYQYLRHHSKHQMTFLYQVVLRLEQSSVISLEFRKPSHILETRQIWSDFSTILWLAWLPLRCQVWINGSNPPFPENFRLHELRLVVSNSKYFSPCQGQQLHPRLTIHVLGIILPWAKTHIY
jgi:hypothetical protein